jgi:hypothetical protein
VKTRIALTATLVAVPVFGFSAQVVMADSGEEPPVTTETTETISEEEAAEAAEAARLAELAIGLQQDIKFHRSKTWHYQKLSFVRRTKSNFEEKNPHGITYLQWMKKTWQKRHIKAKRFFTSFQYADRPLLPHQARIVGMRLAKKLYGWAGEQWRCLDDLWGDEESSWRWWADNPTSPAYGIPQALPGSKMGPGWVKSVLVQIRWGLRYIKGRYFSPCGALGFHRHNNAY